MRSKTCKTIIMALTSFLNHCARQESDFASELQMPLHIIKVGDASFSRQQISAMIDRTNKKLTPTGIRVMPKKYHEIGPVHFANLNAENIEEILNYHAGLNELRLFLIKEDGLYGLQSWTYDPFNHNDFPEIYSGAIFITEAFNCNDDKY